MMTRIDFYLLAEPDLQARWLFACRLCEKAYQKRHKIYMLVNSPEEATQLDELLWSFRDDSFLPHALAAESTPTKAPIHIGTTAPTEPQEILINLTPTIPNFFQQFQRIIEIIGENETDRALARENFRVYRNQGFTIESHKIEKAPKV